MKRMVFLAAVCGCGGGPCVTEIHGVFDAEITRLDGDLKGQVFLDVFRIPDENVPLLNSGDASFMIQSDAVRCTGTEETDGDSLVRTVECVNTENGGVVAEESATLEVECSADGDIESITTDDLTYASPFLEGDGTPSRYAVRLTPVE